MSADKDDLSAETICSLEDRGHEGQWWRRGFRADGVNVIRRTV
jgi:hypothetical protein